MPVSNTHDRIPTVPVRAPAVWLTGWVGVVFVAMYGLAYLGGAARYLPGAFSSLGSQGRGASDSGPIPHELLIITTVAACLALLVARRPAYAPHVVIGRPGRVGMLTAAASAGAAAAVMCATGLGAGWLQGNVLSQAQSSRNEANLGAPMRLVDAMWAGSLEETSYVLAPWAVVAGWAVFRRRPIRRRDLIVLVVACGVIRAVLHTYQGPIPALAALMWGAAMAGLFIWARSVLALIVAHAAFDWIAGSRTPLHAGTLLAAGVLLTIVMLIVVRLHRKEPATCPPEASPRTHPAQGSVRTG